jgi:hypothetical protein
MELDFRNRGWITVEGLEAVARNGALTSLRIAVCTTVTDQSLMLAECCPLLTSVGIRFYSQLTDTTICVN